MYMGQILICAGIAMIALSIVLMLVLTVVFEKNKKKFINRKYGETEERDS